MAQVRAAAVCAGVVGLLLAALVTTAEAQEERLLGGKVRAGESVVIPAGEVVPGDLVVAGGTVRVEGRVEGDLMAAGGQIDVPGTVTGDALIAGGTITVGGTVDGDLRAVGGQLTVTGAVGEDVVLAGGQGTVGSAAQVGEDLIFAAGQVRMDGRVARDVLGTTGEYTRGGEVAGAENVSIEEPEPARAPTAGERVLGGLRRVLTLLLVGALLLWLAPRTVRGAAQRLHDRPLPSLGVGLLALVAPAALAVLIALVTVLLAIVFGLVGLGSLVAAVVLGMILLLVLIGFVLSLAVVFVAPVVVAFLLGRMLLGGDDQAAQPLSRALAALAVGVLLVVLLTALPFIGGVLWLAVVAFGLGALLLGLWRARGRQTAATAAVSREPQAEPLPPGP